MTFNYETPCMHFQWYIFTDYWSVLYFKNVEFNPFWYIWLSNSVLIIVKCVVELIPVSNIVSNSFLSYWIPELAQIVELSHICQNFVSIWVFVEPIIAYLASLQKICMIFWGFLFNWNIWGDICLWLCVHKNLLHRIQFCKVRKISFIHTAHRQFITFFHCFPQCMSDWTIHKYILLSVEHNWLKYTSKL